jgi:hypothetical protein
VRSGRSTTTRPPACSEVEYDRHHPKPFGALHPLSSSLFCYPSRRSRAGVKAELELALVRPGAMPGAQGAGRTRTLTGRADLDGVVVMAG